MEVVVKYVAIPLLAMAAGAAAPTLAANPDSPDKEPKLRVTQFYGAAPAAMGLPPGSVVSEAMNEYCGVQGPEKLAPGVAVLGGIVVDWLAGLVVKQMKESVLADIKAHTASYRNDLSYADFYEPGKWSKKEKGAKPHTCVIAQRFRSCPAKPAQDAPPCDDKQPAATALFVLERERAALSVTPVAYEFQQFLPKHSPPKNKSAKLAFSVGLTMHAIGTQDGSGFYWDSKQAGKELLLIDDDCMVTSNRQPDGACQWRASFLDRPDAKMLPLPPGSQASTPFSLAALEVNFAEVGRPRGGSKALASFLDASGEDLSKAAASALKKQWKLGEPE